MLRLYASGLPDSIAGASGRAPHALGAHPPFSSTPACAAREIHAASPVEALTRSIFFVVLNIVMHSPPKIFILLTLPASSIREALVKPEKENIIICSSVHMEDFGSG
jgi:hypothetical protein